MYGLQSQKYFPVAYPLGKACLILCLVGWLQWIQSGYGKRLHVIFLPLPHILHTHTFLYTDKRKDIHEKSQIPIIGSSADVKILIHGAETGIAIWFYRSPPWENKRPAFIPRGRVGNLTAWRAPVCKGIRVSLASWKLSPTGYQSLPLAWPWLCHNPTEIGLQFLV